jgi:hypothetical protein
MDTDAVIRRFRQERHGVRRRLQHHLLL